MDWYFNFHDLLAQQSQKIELKNRPWYSIGIFDILKFQCYEIQLPALPFGDNFKANDLSPLN